MVTNVNFSLKLEVRKNFEQPFGDGDNYHATAAQKDVADAIGEAIASLRSKGYQVVRPIDLCLEIG